MDLWEPRERRRRLTWISLDETQDYNNFTQHYCVEWSCRFMICRPLLRGDHLSRDRIFNYLAMKTKGGIILCHII
jgi:hypothetical protein